MEEYQFDLSQFEDDISKANAVMSWLANRAFAYDKTRFNNIVLELNDDAIGAVAYEICKICTVFANTKFYTSKIAKKSRYFNKQGVVKTVSRRKLNKIIKQEDTIFWNATTTADNGDCDERPIIFYGFSSELLHFVATTLYGWNPDRKEYIKANKRAHKEAIKAAKVAAKEAKRENRNNKRKGKTR